jgi:hypothetical protein
MGCDKYRSGEKLGRNVKSLIGAFVVILALLALSPVSEAGTIRTVGHTVGADYWDILDAINASDDCDTIQVWYGTYNEQLLLTIR